MTDMLTARIRCRTCGAEYTVALGYSVGAPHGPNKDCRAPDGWERLPDIAASDADVSVTAP